MKSKVKKFIKRSVIIIVSLVLICLAVFSRAIGPAIEFTRSPVYTGHSFLTYPMPGYDASKKTVMIIADKDGTEMFDMLAPFYLFNSTGMANVFIVAEKLEPIVVRKGLFVLPQLTFAQVDSMNIKPDVIVVPNQSVMVGMKQKKATVNFIKEHYNGQNRILSVCDGSATVASTGIYDGKPLTTHSSDYEPIKKQYGKPAWTQGVRVTQSGNLFSTAGVSNATEGSLIVIRDLFGESVMQAVQAGIHYPAIEIKMDHQNKVVTTDAIFIAIKKGAFKRNEKIGVLLKDSVNEFDLAATLDTYTRSFPSSIESFSIGNKPIVSKYGLTMIATGDISTGGDCTELHVLNNLTVTKTDEALFPKAQVIRYGEVNDQYIIDTCLQRIEALYGKEFAQTVRLMLDYN
ncbi:MAG: DJ-1/PfpI family protein [Bacteroidota bacterium]